MIIHKGYENLDIQSPVVTLGIFDGVHRGHRYLLDRLVNRAKETGGDSVVVTFSPHPRIVLEGDKNNITFLTTAEEKKELLWEAGIDHLVIVRFTKKFSRIPACDFVRDILAGKIGAKNLIVGYDHHFGRRGEGDFETIRQCEGVSDFSLEQVKGLNAAGGAISSTAIRTALLEGRIDDASNLLGYDYSLAGTIIEGEKIGRSIGFPTANICPDMHKLIPAFGVYAVQVIIENRTYPGMLSIGTNPTMNTSGGSRTIEVNILDFDRNVYGSTIRVVFRKRLREEKRFDSIDQLVAQMMVDKEDTLKLFS